MLTGDTTPIGPLADVLEINVRMDMLRSLKVFENMEAVPQMRLAESMRVLKFQGGENIITAGQPAQEFCIIKSGKVGYQRQVRPASGPWHPPYGIEIRDTIRRTIFRAALHRDALEPICPQNRAITRILRAGWDALERIGKGDWWAHQDSNLEPDRYERSALTIELWAPGASIAGA